MLDGTLFVVKCARCGIPGLKPPRNSFFMYHLPKALYRNVKLFNLKRLDIFLKRLDVLTQTSRRFNFSYKYSNSFNLWV